MRHPWYCDGREDGLREGREEGLEPLLFLFERRLERTLTNSERRRITARLVKEGPEVLGSVVLDLSQQKLAAWLEPRKTAAKRRAA